MRLPKSVIPWRWETPEEGWIKVNFDGAMSKAGSKGGGGAVLRDHNGAFLAGVSHFFKDVVDPESAEILGCQRAVKFARERGIEKVHLELDNKGLVLILKDQQKNLATVRPWIQEIKSLMSSF